MAIIIGITGTHGAGKGTVVDYLVEKYGFKHFTFRGYFIKELEKRGGPIDRNTIREFANELRATLGEKYFDEVLGAVYVSGENYVVESIRTPSEVAFLSQQPDTYLFAVDASQQNRYERAILRGSETDHVTFEQFCEQEAKEMQSTDPNKQNLAYCMDHTDPAFRFINDGTMEVFHAQIDAVMQGLMKT